MVSNQLVSTFYHSVIFCKNSTGHKKKKKKATKFWRENSNIKQANNIALTYGEAYIQ